MLSQTNMNNSDFVFTFQVLISNPMTAFDSEERVYFGGYSDDLNMEGPQNYEVSGIMRLTATPVPLPAACSSWALAWRGWGCSAAANSSRDKG